MKTLSWSLPRGAVLAGLTALILAAATGTAEARKLVCYKDLGRGTVCEWVK